MSGWLFLFLGLLGFRLAPEKQKVVYIVYALQMYVWNI